MQRGCEGIAANAQQQLNPLESIFTEVSPTVGTHAAPAQWLAFMQACSQPAPLPLSLQSIPTGDKERGFSACIIQA